MSFLVGPLRVVGLWTAISANSPHYIEIMLFFWSVLWCCFPSSHSAPPADPIPIFEYAKFISDDMAAFGFTFGTSDSGNSGITLLVDMDRSDTWIASQSCGTTRCDFMPLKYDQSGTKLGCRQYKASYAIHPDVACGPAYEDTITTSLLTLNDPTINQVFIAASDVNRFFPTIFASDFAASVAEGVIALGPHTKSSALGRCLNSTLPSNSFLINFNKAYTPTIEYEAFFFSRDVSANGAQITSGELYTSFFEGAPLEYIKGDLLPLAPPCHLCPCTPYGWTIVPTSPMKISLGTVEMSFSVDSLTFDPPKLFNVATQQFANAYAAAFQKSLDVVNKATGKCYRLKRKKFQLKTIFQYDCDAGVEPDLVWPQISFDVIGEAGNSISLVFDGPQGLQVSDNCYLSFAGTLAPGYVGRSVIIGYPGLNVDNGGDPSINDSYPYFVIKKQPDDSYTPFLVIHP